MGKKEDGVNPVEQWRRQQKKSNVKKRKAAREQRRGETTSELPAQQRDPSKLLQDIYRATILEHEGKLTGDGRMHKKRLMDQFHSLNKARLASGMEKLELPTFDPEKHDQIRKRARQRHNNMEGMRRSMGKDGVEREPVQEDEDEEQEWDMRQNHFNAVAKKAKHTVPHADHSHPEHDDIGDNEEDEDDDDDVAMHQALPPLPSEDAPDEAPPGLPPFLPPLLADDDLDYESGDGQYYGQGDDIYDQQQCDYYIDDDDASGKENASSFLPEEIEDKKFAESDTETSLHGGADLPFHQSEDEADEGKEADEEEKEADEEKEENTVKTLRKDEKAAAIVIEAAPQIRNMLTESARLVPTALLRQHQQPSHSTASTAARHHPAQAAATGMTKESDNGGSNVDEEEKMQRFLEEINSIPQM